MPSDELQHFGVKGMKWGKRSAKAASSPRPKKMTRQEIRADKDAFYQKKLKNVIDTAMKDPENLISLRAAGTPFQTLVTGREFIEYASQGGIMDATMTDVYATKRGDKYLLNENVNAKYRKPGR